MKEREKKEDGLRVKKKVWKMEGIMIVKKEK